MTMKWCFRLAGIGGGVAVFVLFSTLTAHAIPLSNTAISSDDFSAACTSLMSLVSTFDFDPSTMGGDGSVTSTVYNCGTGYFGYTYQIFHSSGSSESLIRGISMDWNFLTYFTFDSTVTTSFWITGSGTPAPSDADMSPSFTKGSLHFGFTGILPGATSAIFGAVSTAPPITVVADVINTGSTLQSASVLAPTPEPGTLALLASALTGFGVIRRRRGLVPRRAT